MDPNDVVRILGEKLVSSVLIEGGGSIHAAFLENQLVDKVEIYIAPKLVGGTQAPTFLEGTGVELMRDAVDLEDLHITQIGKDFKFTGYPKYIENKLRVFNMKFGFDIDDTLINLREHAFQIYNKNLNQNVDIDLFHALDKVEIHELFGMTAEEGSEMWNSSLRRNLFHIMPTLS